MLVVTQTLAPGHPLILVGSDFSPVNAQPPDPVCARAHCPASLSDFPGRPCPCPSSYVIYTQFQFLL